MGEGGGATAGLAAGAAAGADGGAAADVEIRAGAEDGVAADAGAACWRFAGGSDWLTAADEARPAESCFKNRGMTCQTARSAAPAAARNSTRSR